MKDNKNKKLNTESTPVGSEQITITPTMIDNEEIGKKNQKKDLSAIIPEQNNQTENTDGIVLESKDKELKSDGAIVIANIVNDDIVMDEKAVLPAQIDIEARKRNRANMLKSKKRKNKVELDDEAKKSQNITSIIVLILICLLGGFAYYIYNRKTLKDFQPLPVTVELGDKLPIRTKNYVKPGVGNTVDELKYVLNTKDVDIDEVGEYNFTVTFNNITKTGTIKIVDTTAPDLTVKRVVITEGTTYGPESFVDECIDLSGCNYSFEDSKTTEKYRTPGTYNVYIVATDPYENKTTKKTQLVIEAQGMVKKLVKTEEYSENKGYSLKTTYDLHFSSFMDNAILYNGYKIEEYQYRNDEKFNEAKTKYTGEANYTIDTKNKTIKYEPDPVSQINNYSTLDDIVTSLKANGFTEQ